MSDERIEYCPWCGGEVSRSLEQHDGLAVNANKCGDCGITFRVEVPHKESRIEWTIAR
jgi:transcription elongation factor Elf1